MSNGVPPCCPLEICCDAPAAKAKVAESMGQEFTDKMYTWMAEHGLIFAPKSLRPFVQEIVLMARSSKP